MSQDYQNYIDGKWCDAADGAAFDDVNPANLDEVVARFPRSSVTDMAQAIGAAKAARPTWRAAPPAARAAILKKALALMIERTDEMARVLTLENGKTLAESKAEITAAMKEMEFQIAEGVRLFGKTAPSEQDGVMCYSTHQPLGVVGVITPWNFPFNVVSRKAIPALMGGNTIVFKPASFTPWTGLKYTELLVDAGMPAGVVNFITGPGGAVGDALVEHADVSAVSFTGSTEVGRGIERKAVAHGAKVQLEMGGKNPAVVLEDADLDAAAAAILLGAYACAGQWCTSTSRAVVVKGVADELTRRLVDGAGRIVSGNGLDANTTMGPVAGPNQLDKILEYIQIGQDEGAELLIGGHRDTEGDCAKGTFVAPTIFADVTPAMRIAQEEIFGPVLSIMVVSDLDEAIEVANGVAFGLASSIFTNDLSRAMTFIERTEVGLTHVNMPTGYKESQLEFGGIKDSGAGPPEAGHSAIEFFTEHKVAYVKYR